MSDATAVLPAFALHDLPGHHRAAVSFLARYQGQTFELYERYLRVWFEWCEARGLDPIVTARGRDGDDPRAVTRGHVELWVREFSATHKASTVGAAFTPIRGFYRFAHLDGLIDIDPSAHVRLPKVVYTRKPPLDRQDIRRILLAAKSLSPRHWALTQLLGVMGLRVSEACSITVEQALHVEQGMRVLRYIGKGSKPAATPVPYTSLAAIDTAIAGRTSGWLIAKRDGGQMNRHGAATLVATVARHADVELTRPLNPHYLRALAITQVRDAGLSLEEMRRFARHEDERTTRRHYDLTQDELGSHPVHTIGARLAI
ncbi:tyrosine-type recombinase/integrase [Microcystis phage MinS1]|nr:tyrosine-type recombinase/integrase [Microcystis phage MinS1]